MKEAIFENLISCATDEYSIFIDLFEFNGIIPLLTRKEKDLFVFLIRTLIGQQLSNKAADKIWERLLAFCCNEKLYDFCENENTLKLRSAGLSNNKIKAVFHLKSAFKNKQLSSKLVKESDAVKTRKLITKVWGFGDWSADMTSIFYSCHTDVWPNNDTALERGIKHITKSNIPSYIIAERFSPYRTYLAKHIWNGIDNGFIGKIK